jgi:hypothetical protein
MKKSILIIMIAFLGCKEEEELNISSFNDIETVSDEICIYKALYTQTDTIEYVEECFVVDTAYYIDDIGLVSIKKYTEPYETGVQVPNKVGTYNVEESAYITNFMRTTGRLDGYTNIRASYGSVTVTECNDSVISGTFHGWGNVMEGTKYEQDSTFDISGSFNNVNYR